jgi:hypothetical protein
MISAVSHQQQLNGNSKQYTSMKKLFAVLVLIIAIGSSVNAQNIQRHKIAIFTPLYLDSAFDAAGNYRFEKNNPPKFLTPGMDFYYGAQLALDSLQRRGAPLEVYICDSRSKELLNQQLNKPEFRDLELMIAESNYIETKILADNAQKKKIPFISATLPNDAGITNNPYFVVLNSTLQAHVEGIYRFIQKYHSMDNIVVFRKSGAQEDQIKDYFNEFAKTTVSVPLKINFVDVGSDFTIQSLASKLDSTKHTVCIAGSLDEFFGTRLVESLASISNTYPVTAMGMPTWDNINFNKPSISNLEIIYSTPFFYNHGTPLENQLATDYSNKISSHPTDMFFRGYETTLRFALLLLDTKKDVASNLTRKGNTILTQFDIQPVFKDRASMTLDYFENKHLYFVKVLGGVKNILY